MEQQIALVKKPSTYKMVIPKEVEEKIRFTCNQVWNTEWSGVLFYDVQGGFETNDLVIICKDIFLMDIGSATYTEFNMSPDVVAYMAEHPELFDYQSGLLHSHNNMATFFSGTDVTTLRDEGKDMNNFVSLIVNNAGTYTAAITRKIKSTRTIQDNSSYDFFGQGTINIATQNYTTEVVEIQYFMLDIEKATVANNQNELHARLEEIRKKKAAQKPITTTPSSSSSIIQKPKTLFDDWEDWEPYYPLNATKPAATPKKEAEKEEALEDGLGEPVPYGVLTANKSIIRGLLLQTITCSLIISDQSKIDVTKWANNMPVSFAKRFQSEEIFREWASLFMEFITWYTEDPELYLAGCNEEECQAIIAYDLQQALQKLPINKYIKIFIEELDKYII